MYNKGVPLHSGSNPPSFDELLNVGRERVETEELKYNEVVSLFLNFLDIIQTLEPSVYALRAHQSILAIVDSMIADAYTHYPFEEGSMED